MPTAPRRSRNPHACSAAGFVGVIGIPDPGHGPALHDGGLYAFCQRFNRAADRFLALREAAADRERRSRLRPSA